jgi:glycosyltransferase involved in cell wall biosynthesis
VLSVTDPGFRYDYPDVVRFELPERSFSSYQRAADFINLSHTDLLCIQHEFGIYGGPAGSHLLNLMRRLRLPVVTTLHTVLEDPTAEQRRVMEELVQQSDALVVMSERGQRILGSTYQVPPGKVHLIPHGIPDLPFVDPNFYKDQYGVAGRPMMLTFGLLSPGKGIEYGIQALPGILARHPDLVYVILGATHPNLVRAEGETYRLSLERLAQSLGVENNVIFVNRYVDDQQLMEYIGAADIYLTPYLNPAQITSGTLAYCYGAGKAVVSTPYWHAEELLADGRGLLVPFRDGAAIAAAVNGLLDQPARLHALRKQAWLAGREMVWAAVGERYAQLFEGLLEASEGRVRTLRPAATLAVEGAELPPWRFQHLEAMADSTGVFQHAVHSVPDFNHGYCTDDNARALLFTAQLEHLGEPLNGLRRLHPPPPRSSTTPSWPRAAAFATSWGLTAAGWRAWARKTATAGRCGVWGPSWAARSKPTCATGRPDSSSRPCPCWRGSPRPGPGPLRCWVCTNTCGCSMGICWRPAGAWSCRSGCSPPSAPRAAPIGLGWSRS